VPFTTSPPGAIKENRSLKARLTENLKETQSVKSVGLTLFALLT
jgi:hypothetical protein